MILKKFIKTSSLFFIIIISLSKCNHDKNVTNSDNSPFTSHDFIWEIDTLQAPDAMQINMKDIWGTDQDNVWIVGHSDDFNYQVWHWDGTTWININPIIYGDRPSYREILGFSVNDLWIVGVGITQIINEPNLQRREYILHYDGTQWERYTQIKAPPCLSIWGTSRDDLYFGCDSGIVLYKNGSIWEKQNTGTDAQIISM